MTSNFGERPTLENLLEQAASNGWAFFDGPGGLGAQTRGQIEDTKSQRVAALAAALYEVEEFRELLAFLCEVSLHRQTFVTALVGVNRDERYAYGDFREGQNSMVFTIFKLIAQGRDQALKGRDA